MLEKIIMLKSVFLLSAFYLYADFDKNISEFKQISSKVEVPPTKNLSISTPTVPPDSINFWDRLNSGVLDNLCKQAKIRINQDAEIPNIGGITGEFRRWFEKYPDKTLALVDEVGLKLNTSLASDILNIENFGALNVSISGAIEGKSLVVTPLGTDRYCSEMKLLVDLRKVKTVLPLTKERILNMKEGEIWKIPFVTYLSFGGGVGGQVVPYLSISFGAYTSKTRTPSVSLYRIDDNDLRLRIRIERVLVKAMNAQLASTYEISPTDIGFFEAENIFSKFVEKEIAKQINKYIALRFGYNFSKSKSNKLLLEFLINIKDNKQMEALEEFLNGDLTLIKKLIKIGIRFNEFDESDNYSVGLDNLNNTVSEVSQGLQTKPTYAGSAHSHSQGSSFNINVPFIHSHQFANSSGYEKYQSIDGSSVTHIYNAQRVSDGSTFNIPFLGSIVKYREEEKVISVAKEHAKRIDDPALLYQYNSGFVRNSEYSARAMIDKANGILKYIGTDGEGTNNKYVLNSESIFPKSEIEYDSEGNPINNYKTYKQAMMSFNLMIAKEGIKEIIFSTPQRILKAYLNMMKEFDEYFVNKFYNAFRVEGEKVVFDYNKIERDEYYQDVFSVVSQMAYTATKLIEDLFSLRTETDNKKQAEKLVAIASGKGRSGLSYDAFMKVIVQLVTPVNMAGNIYISTNKRVKGEDDINQTYTVDPENNLNRIMTEINQERERFSSPSILKD